MPTFPFMVCQMYDIHISHSMTLLYRRFLTFFSIHDLFQVLQNTHALPLSHVHCSCYYYLYIIMLLSVHWAYCSAVFLSCFLRQVPKIWIWARELVIGEQLLGYLLDVVLRSYCRLIFYFHPHHSCLISFRMPMFNSGLCCIISYAFISLCLYYALMRNHD